MFAIPKIIQDSILDELKDSTWEKDGKMILAQREKTFLNQKEKTKLKYLITLGTPKKYRRTLWLLSTGASEFLRKESNYYNNLNNLSREMPCQNSLQIDKDLKRSQFKQYPCFIEKVRRILLCYSLRNSSIGYCQGFNFIVEKILLIMHGNIRENGDPNEIGGDEEETFWVFTQLIEEILPLNYYSELAGVIIDTTIINEFLKKYFPRLRNFFDQNSFNVNNFVHKWLVTLFTENFQEETTYLIWDFLFLEGNIVLIKTCLIIICILKRQLLKNENNFEELFTIFLSETAKISPKNATLLHGLSLKKFEFTIEYLEETRDMVSFSIVENIDKENSEKFSRKINQNKKEERKGTAKNIKCNLNWPLCSYESEINKPTLVIKYLILRSSSNMMIRDYFFDNLKDNKMTKPTFVDKNFLLERHEHYCKHYINSPFKGELMDSKIEEKENLFPIQSIGNETNELYIRMAKNKHYIEAKERIGKEFNAKPYN